MTKKFSGNIYNDAAHKKLVNTLLTNVIVEKEFDLLAVNKALPILEENLVAAPDVEEVIEDAKKRG